MTILGGALILTLWASCIVALPVLGAKALLAIEAEVRERGGFTL